MLETMQISIKKKKEKQILVYRGLVNNKIYLYTQQHGWMDGTQKHVE